LTNIIPSIAGMNASYRRQGVAANGTTIANAKSCNAAMPHINLRWRDVAVRSDRETTVALAASEYAISQINPGDWPFRVTHLNDARKFGSEPLS